MHGLTQSLQGNLRPTYHHYLIVCPIPALSLTCVRCSLLGKNNCAFDSVFHQIKHECGSLELKKQFLIDIIAGMPRKIKSQRSQGSLAIDAASGLKSKSRRCLTQQKEHLYRSDALLNETSLSINFGGAPKKAKKARKEDFKIVKVSVDKDQEFSYIGENQKNSQLKYFTKKRIVESPELFASVIDFYSEQIKTLLMATANGAKLEENKNPGL